MYSGITQGVYPVVTVTKKPGLIEYQVALSDELIQGATVGCSINIDGVCQTVTAINGTTVSFAAMQQTLQLTTLNDLAVGRQVSVERSIRFGDEIGGHVVAGHVTGTATINLRSQQENNLSLTFQCPPAWLEYIFPQGFIAVDGSSLTVTTVNPAGYFSVSLIPETLKLTNLIHKLVGDRANIELDHTTRTIVDTVKRIHQSISTRC